MQRAAVLLVTLLMACGDDGAAVESPPAGDDAAVNGAADAARPAPAAGNSPIDVPAGEWHWEEFPDTSCRDGSAAGLSVYLVPGSERVMIYLEGGGSCFDAETCASNPPEVVVRAPEASGIFDRAHADNPVGDWSFVYIPYCSGDLHMGDARDVSIAGVEGLQQFQGRPNLERFLERLVPTFADARQVLLTGVSAGGLGALVNYGVVQSAFGSIPVDMIDDSGPAVSIDHVPACLNQLRRQHWGLDRTVIAECGDECDAQGDFLLQYARRTLRQSVGHSGLIHSIHDIIIRAFFGIGTNGGSDDCGGVLLETIMEAEALEAALRDARDQLSEEAPRFGTFFPEGTDHGWITTPAFYEAGVGDTTMVEWFRAVIEGAPAQHVAP
jgi:hypothetical protein